MNVFFVLPLQIYTFFVKVGLLFLEIFERCLHLGRNDAKKPLSILLV